jgi:hypothetical protein
MYMVTYSLTAKNSKFAKFSKKLLFVFYAFFAVKFLLNPSDYCRSTTTDLNGSTGREHAHSFESRVSSFVF